MKKRFASSLAAVSLVGLLGASHADAFCGFYVSGADAKLFADATQVVLMRDGTRTVLSMQNDYKGPPEDFALVVPVPVVLQQENVKTLSADVFKRIDTLSAPRLVEYWEQDPCPTSVGLGDIGGFGHGAGTGTGLGIGSGRGSLGEPLVKVEAQFAVGEYEVVILSAKDSSALEAWLRENKYKMPDGAGAALAPYVQAGLKFFVAKVNVAKVKMEDGRASLSPLRFYYDTDKFELPVRLGLLNSSGTQDLIVNILAADRYEAASHPNATIPTNLDVNESARASFGTFYAALFDDTLAKHPGAVVTEYAWQSTKCDPCPGDSAGMTGNDLASLGADVMPNMQVTARRGLGAPTTKMGPAAITGRLPPEVIRRMLGQNLGRVRLCYEGGLKNNPALAGRVAVKFKIGAKGDVESAVDGGSTLPDQSVVSCITRAMQHLSFPEPEDKKTVTVTQPYDLSPPEKTATVPANVFVNVTNANNGLVLTRLHARYGKDTLGKDLVFRVADPIGGGRESWTANKLETGATKLSAGSVSAFQARYAIRHPWRGKIECETPKRGVWGSRWIEDGGAAPVESTVTATKLAYVARNGDLAAFTNVSAAALVDTPTIAPADAGTFGADASNAPADKPSRCGCRVVGERGGVAPVLAFVLGALALGRRRARRGVVARSGHVSSVS